MTPAAKASSPDNEEELPDGMKEALEAAWAKKHHSHLSGARLLIGGDFNRVYNCIVKKKPREIPKMDPENTASLLRGLQANRKDSSSASQVL